MNIGEKLKSAMKRMNISQNMLARQVGISQAYVSLICSGKKIPTIGTLTQIANCLGIPVGRLMADGTAQPGDLSTERLVPNDEEERILRRYRSMSERDKAVVYCIVDQLCGFHEIQQQECS